MPPIEPASPRSARSGNPSLIQWGGCELVQVDPKNPKHIPANATVVLKVELKGWPDISDDVPECRLGARVPLETIANLEFTRDDLHRRYGPGIYFVHAYVAGEDAKGVQTLHTPIQGETHTIDACEFDNEKPNDPEDPDEDVGMQAWKVPASATASSVELKEEIARRKEVRKSLGIGEERRSGERGRGGRMGARGGRMGARPSRGRERGWGPDSDYDDDGRGFDDEPEEPEDVYDPSWMHPEAPPGKKWYFCGNPLKWRLMDAGSTQAAAPAAPPAPTGLFAGVDPEVKTLVVGGVVAMLKGLFDKVTADKPDPTKSTVELMAALRPPQADPAELKRIELAAEERREAREAAARLETARLAKEQRDHEAAMERERIAAAERAAIAAAAAAEAREDKMVSRRLNGLIPPEGPTAAQMAAEKQLAVMQAQIQWMQNAPKTPDVMEAFDKAKTMLTKFGLKVGDGEDAGSAIAKALDNPAATALATGIAPGINALFLKLAGGEPQPAQQGPTQAQIDAWAAQQRELGRQQALAEMQRQQAQQAAAQGIPGVPAPEQMQASPFGAWVEQPAPVEPAAPPMEPPAPVAEAPAEPEPPPVEEPAQEPEAPAVEPEPTPESTPEPEAPAEAIEAPRALPLDLPPPDPNSIIDQQPEATA